MAKEVETREKVSTKHPVEPVKASPAAFAPADLIRRFLDAGARAGFAAAPFGEIEGFPLIALTKRTPGPRPRLYFSAGIHGDEPAPPLALLHLLEQGVFDERAVWFLCPLLNPVGFTLGTRENRGRLDLNRDYRASQSAEIRAHVAWLERQPAFDAAFCAHEDWESKGYYLYELNPLRRRSLAEPIMAAVAPVCPPDLSAEIDGRPASGGIIRPDIDPAQRELWPESIYLRAHHTGQSYTLESPSAFPLAVRIAAHERALRAAIGLLLAPPP